MEQDMTLYQIINILETKGFFKFTVKVIDESNLEYTFKSFKWNNMMTLKVAIIKFQKQKFIRHVAINDKKKINTMEDFEKLMNNLYQIHKEIKKKNIKYVGKDKFNNNDYNTHRYRNTNNE